MYDETPQNFEYSNDVTGSILSITDSLAGPQVQSFAYDTLDRLTSADAVGGLDGLYAETYGYDASTGNLASKGGNTYTYGDANHAHAVTSLSSGNAYTYDANGNQITRVIGADTYTQIYDAENKLVQVVKNGNTIAAFTYDGDGTRVASTNNGVATKFVGEYYEVSGTNVTKYYGGKTAMRINGVLTYLLSDHLGSNSQIVDASGNKLSETRYKAWGEIRYSTGTTTTPYSYTGQYSNTADFGWMYYKARWYDSTLGRFAQADSIVPGAGDPRAWDRYSYVKNSPVVYNDPSGHMMSPGDRNSWGDGGGKTVNKYGIVSKQIIPVRQPVQTPYNQSNTPYTTQTPLVRVDIAYKGQSTEIYLSHQIPRAATQSTKALYSNYYLQGPSGRAGKFTTPFDVEYEGQAISPGISLNKSMGIVTGEDVDRLGVSALKGASTHTGASIGVGYENMVANNPLTGEPEPNKLNGHSLTIGAGAPFGAEFHNVVMYSMPIFHTDSLLISSILYSIFH